MSEIVVAPELMEAERFRVERMPDEALRVCAKFMNNNFNDVASLVMAAHVLMDADRHGLAHPLLMHALKIAPDQPLIYNNLALCYLEIEEFEEAERCFIKALTRDPKDDLALCNMAKLYNQTGQPQKALNCSEKAIALNPKRPEGRYNKGISLLSMGNWKDGWEGYEYNLGKHQGRRERVYGSLPRWTGVPGLNVIAYGEQGVGDEINFASCIPDLQKQANVIIECDHRLEGLFKRSFGCEVYGTRYHKKIDWPAKHQIDASVAFGSLPGFYRNAQEEFPGTPYLKADPQRRVQWKALLEALGPKLKVGITWSGGLKRTGSRFRSLKLEDLMPILRQDATFISLQYKDAPEVEALQETHGIQVHHWKHATQTQDMDDQAALMAELDLVITVQQTAVHLGGGLGVPTWVMIPKAPLWRYGISGNTMPWYQSVKLYRQNSDWLNTIATVATDLRKRIIERSGLETSRG